jgi:hypothetical protein
MQEGSPGRPGPRRPGRPVRSAALAVLIGLCAGAVGCPAPQEPKLPYRAPIFLEPPGDEMLIDSAALALGGDVRLGSFGEVAFHGYRLFGGRFTQVDLGLRRVDPGSDPVLLVYGPRRDGDLWGRAIHVDDDGAGGVNARVRGLRLPELGEYLVVVTSRTPSDGRFELAVLCAEGCDTVTPCPELSCDEEPPCLRGRRNDARGCRTCACLDACVISADCGPGNVCERGACRDDCFCPDDLNLVCGEDGLTYANSCEADCVGVAVAAAGRCPDVCELEDCRLTCPQGFRLGDDACPICACNDGCEQCGAAFEPVCTQNGATYRNACLAQCSGETVAYVGECIAGCPPFACGLTCTDGYARDDDGCPLCACNDAACPGGNARVCGVNGVTYADACARERAGVAPAYEGSCGRLCHGPADCPDSFSCVVLGSSRTVCAGAEDGCVGNCIAPEIAICDTPEDCLAGFECADGLCSLSCQCSPQYNPVCSDDGETYLNACVARCVRAQRVRDGACCRPDALDDCDLECDNGLAVDVDGCEVCACREMAPCECQPVDNPVCGSDERTYQNACEARCVGLSDWSDGACP